ncbi:MAG: hypothetical protein SWQ30_01855 [Thermodesulfobacteriota bacterium]|nr:hypothetical protein [Thermodesulfobacteriota bacterium]
MSNMWADGELKRLCEAFIKETQGLLSWSWDEPLVAVLAQFSVNDRDKVLGCLGPFMGAKWDESEIEKAPEIVRQLAEDMGGLRSGQLLFTTDAGKDVFIFGAWWPWQDDQTISLRVGPHWSELSDSESDDLMASFKACFGI